MTLLSCLAGPLVLLTIAAQLVLSPYSVISPGGVHELASLIELPAEYRQQAGWIAFTAVRIRRANYADWIVARFDPTSRVVPSAELRPDGISDTDYLVSRTRAMAGSKSAASVLALRRAGYPVEINGQGALIERVVKGTAADGRLEPGDLVLSVNDHPTLSANALFVRLRLHKIGDQLKLDVLRAGQRRPVQVALGESQNEPGRAALGVYASTFLFDVTLPFALDLKTDNIIGSSAGLMFCLGLIDVLTPGDLTGGHRVAGTGSISVDGQVGPVGSIAEKVRAAERERADIFLVPRGNADEATGAARALTVVSVATVDQAIEALQALGGALSLP